MNLAKLFVKASQEKRRLYVDYSCFLDDVEKLNGFQAAIQPLTPDSPLAVSLAYSDATNKKLTMMVSGGVGNTDYAISLLVNTDGGQVKRDDIGMRVTP